jgi:hypothetical protein
LPALWRSEVVHAAKFLPLSGLPGKQECRWGAHSGEDVPELLEEQHSKGLGSRGRPVELINVYNASWFPKEVGDHMADDAPR